MDCLLVAHTSQNKMIFLTVAVKGSFSAVMDYCQCLHAQSWRCHHIPLHPPPYCTVPSYHAKGNCPRGGMPPGTM